MHNNSGLEYSVIFPFEEAWDERLFHRWMKDNWTICLYSSVAYVFVVFGGKWYMEDRPRYNLRIPLALWSGILAIFSIFGAIRTWPELLYSTKIGFAHSVCTSHFFEHPVSAFWSMMFTVSKVYELGDTLFIVLRKQQLIFLHWYHHITVMLYVWISYVEHIPSGRWFMTMNYTVHAFMYTYYTLRALRLFNIPRQINMVITGLQLAQMVVGCYINVQVYQIKTQGIQCDQSYENIKYCGLMYSSYFVLFAHFFYTTYMVEKPVKIETHKGHIKQNGDAVHNGKVSKRNGYKKD